MEPPLTLEGLIRFHREAIAPEFARIAATLDEHGHLHRETHAHFDALDQSLDHLQTEYQSIRGALDRLERRMAMLEVRTATAEERLSRLERRVSRLEKSIDDLKQQLGGSITS